MPAKKKSAETTEIKVTSKVTCQVLNGAWYSVECSRNREMHGLTDEEVEKEQEALWEITNKQLDEQVEQVVKANVSEPTWKKLLELLESNNKLDK